VYVSGLNILDLCGYCVQAKRKTRRRRRRGGQYMHSDRRDPL